MQSIDENMIESAAGWGDLEGSLLLKIFKQLPREDLISSTWFVCRWWRSFSSAILFWKEESTLELRTDVKRLSRSRKTDPSQRLKEALKCVMDCFPRGSSSHNCAAVRTILFPRPMVLLDMHINLVAKRSLKLRKLILPKAYTKCKNLEKLNLSKRGRMFYDYPSIYGPGLGKLYGKEISVEVKGDKAYQSMRWFMHTLDESYTPKRGVKGLWSIWFLCA
ncbi:hypothetical protein SLEP1_g47308 [Rubroshorea leprosula]|uniref:F-box domain-containing protein n=1 Tax=Rubroshorea leprosula TaxID=152421 RepID=A0AAV5LPY1_9ROSI|nr:hypothetical protein SLEP1_g47308 [Rubroshorea leprosula]